MSDVLKESLDANESIYFQQQLEYVKAQSSDILYPELKIASGATIPISREAPEGAQSIAYYVYDKTGVAEWVANYADDIPLVGLNGKKVVSPIDPISLGFGYSIFDIQAAALAGKNLNTRQADAVREGIDQKIDKVGFYGDTDRGMYGIWNHPNIQEYILPNDGTGSSTKFSTKTNDQILRDLKAPITQIKTVTKQVENPDTILMSDGIWDLLTTRRLDGTSVTLLEFFLKNSPNITSIDTLNQLTGASDNGDDALIYYKKSPSKLTLEVPVQYKQLPPQAENFGFKVPVYAKLGGVIIYYPLSICKVQYVN